MRLYFNDHGGYELNSYQATSLEFPAAATGAGLIATGFQNALVGLAQQVIPAAIFPHKLRVFL